MFRLNIIEVLVLVGNKSVQVLDRCLYPIFTPTGTLEGPSWEKSAPVHTDTSSGALRAATLER